MADTLSLLSIVSFAVAGVCLVISVILWVVFRIPSVIGDLSGRTARKSIAKLRMANEKSGDKGHRASKVNAQRGKVTETMPDIDKSRQGKKNTDVVRPETGILRDNMSDDIASETTGLLVEDGVTQPLEKSIAREVQQISGVKLELMEEIIFIHTQERID